VGPALVRLLSAKQVVMNRVHTQFEAQLGNSSSIHPIAVSVVIATPDIQAGSDRVHYHRPTKPIRSRMYHIWMTLGQGEPDMFNLQGACLIVPVRCRTIPLVFITGFKKKSLLALFDSVLFSFSEIKVPRQSCTRMTTLAPLNTWTDLWRMFISSVLRKDHVIM
jgi:hypothetical protein